MTLAPRPPTPRPRPSLALSALIRAACTLRRSAPFLALLAFAPPALAAGPPTITKNSAAPPTDICTTLRAGVNSQGAATTYHFEYLTQVKFDENEEEHKGGFEGAERTPESASIGSDDEFHPVSAEVCSLTPATAYRFRAVATNSFSPPGGTAGEAVSFTTLLNGASHKLTATFGTKASGDPVPLAGPTDVAVDQSSGDVYATDPGVDEVQTITLTATGGTFTLAFKSQATAPISYDASAEEVQAALEALSTIGAGNVAVSTASRGVLYEVKFLSGLASTALEPLKADSSALAGTVTVAITAPGVGGAAVEKFSPTGEFLLIFGGDVDETTGGDVCPEHPGDKCKPGKPGSSPGQFVAPTFLAVDNSPTGEGDVYVADTGDGVEHKKPCGAQRQTEACLFNLVQKFEPSGHIDSGWGESGQKDGSDILPNNIEPFFGTLLGIAVDEADGTLFVAGAHTADNNIFEYTQSGAYVPPYRNDEGAFLSLGLKADPQGNIYYPSVGGVESKNPQSEYIEREIPESRAEDVHRFGAVTGVTGFALDPAGQGLYQDTGAAIEHYGPECEPAEGPCEPLDSFGSAALAGAQGLAVGNSQTVYAADPEAGDVAIFEDLAPQAATGPSREVGETALTLTGHVGPETQGPAHASSPIVECRFEYGFTRSFGHLGGYGHTAPCQQSTPIGAEAEVSARVEGLTPITELPVGTVYHYRLLATDEAGATAIGADRTARTTAPPQIEGVSSSHLTATSAELDATVAPNGLPTAYRFEYGTTTTYGQTTPQAEVTGTEEELFQVHKVKVPIEGLQPGVTYHFRLVAENALDTGHPATSEDESFGFFPPTCPNSAVRQQTGSAYLPDCRAYELVSPANANGTLLYSQGPATGLATSPSRFAFTGAFSALPEDPETIGTDGDLYVATRTDTGWVSHYVGLPGDQAACMGGPPTSPWSYASPPQEDKMQDTVLTDPSMSSFLDFADGTGLACYLPGNGTGDADWKITPPSDAPYLWSAEGSLLAHLPSDLSSTTGAAAALTCPVVNSRGVPEQQAVFPHCEGEVTASGDLTHLIFSSNDLSFAEAGLTVAPGSAYDDNLATGKIELISKMASGDIPQDPVYASTGGPHPSYETEAEAIQKAREEFIRFPAVSTDGSHVLISTATATTRFCDKGNDLEPVCPRFTETPIHLYMSIDDRPAVEVSRSEVTEEDVAVDYVGMTEDGSKVFFTSEEHLTGEDLGHAGASLYMWSEQGEREGHPLTLISKADSGSPPGAGDTADCHPALVDELKEGKPTGKEVPWTDRCGVRPYSGWSFAALSGGLGGNGHSDTAIASANGDIYFYSPEQLDGDHGVPGEQNLYDYRGGELRFVTTLTPGPQCRRGEEQTATCSEGPIVRFQVTPEDTHMAFLTADRITPYDNAGHFEMYSYTPATGAIVCDSCNPDGHAATADVSASQDGLFLTEDGRTFFSTEEALVPSDTNNGVDVYEFVGDRPQLITPGTGTAAKGSLGEIPGLIGVSANGTDVYFSTFDSLVSEDHNGDFLKFYDARTDGGFPQPPPNQPCAAAEECHGPGTEAPTLPTQGTAAGLTGGNATPESHSKHHKKKKHKRKSKRHHKRAGHRHGGKK